jgi:hypothetical protein
MNIWVPKFKIIEPKRQLVLPMRMRGFFKCEAVHRDTGRRRMLADWFPNLITNVGLDALATGGYLTACRVGSNGTAPANTDTDMGTYIAGTSTRTSSDLLNSGAAEYYTARTNVYRFGEGVAEGNIAEIGIATTTGTGTGVLFSRALVLDGGGSPTTITVLSDEFLDVTYQLRNYPSLTDVVDTINISGVDYDYTLRSADVDNSTTWGGRETGGATGEPSVIGVGTFGTAHAGAIGTITGLPAGASGVSSGAAASAYVPGSHVKEFTLTWGLSFGNLSPGIQSVSTNFGTEARSGAMQVQFDPFIPKDNTKVFTLEFQQAWARGTI